MHDDEKYLGLLYEIITLPVLKKVHDRQKQLITQEQQCGYN